MSDITIITILMAIGLFGALAMTLHGIKKEPCSQCGKNKSKLFDSLCKDCIRENEIDYEKMQSLLKEGHKKHCVQRIVWGDGQCECRKGANEHRKGEINKT